MQLPRSSPGGDRRRSLWVLVVGAWTAFGLVNGTLWAVASREPQLAFRWTYASAMVVAWSWALVTPLIFRATRVWRPSRIGWPASIAAHASLALACAAGATWVRSTAISFFSSYKPDPYLSAAIYWLDVWVFVYLTLVVIGRALDLRRRYADRTMRADRLEAQLARAQLRYLESQLQPHFLFNALNTIQELAHEAPAAAERMLQRLRALLRMSFDRYGQDEVTLADELAGLEPYLDIQRTRFSNWLSVVVDAPPGTRQALVPRLVLQPLVENAIRHGLAVRQAPGEVRISARRHGDRLRLTVRDDGVGLRPDTQRGGTGIGLGNVQERLRQLHGSDQQFELRPAAGGGAEVELEIPFRESARDVAAAQPMALPDRPADEAPAWTGEFAAVAAGAPEPAAVSTAPPLRAEKDSPALSPRVWLGIVGVWVLLSVFWTNQLVLFYAGWTATEREYSLWAVARLQLATSAIWLALSLPVLLAARRFRLTPRNWPWRLPVHVAFAVACGIIHMDTIRRLGFTNMPALSYSNLNPLTGDFFIYFAMLAWSHSRDFVAWFRARDLEASRLSAQVARSRFQALRVQLRPDFLDATLARLAEMVHSDVARAERLIVRLADMLRLTLESGRHAASTLAEELALVSASVEAHRLAVRTGLRLECKVPSSVLPDEVPSRLICTVVDELLANAPGTADDSLVIAIEAHSVSGCTQVTVRAVTAARLDRPHLWWRTNGVAERAVKSAESHVSVLTPDASSVMLMIGDAPVLADSFAPREFAGAVS